MFLDEKQVGDAFRTIMLVENYNFLEEDLVALANAFVKAAEPQIIKDERTACVKVARTLNHFVANKVQEIRDNT